MSEKKMTGREALLAYGYQQDAIGRFVRQSGGDVWVPAEGGWHLYQRATPPIGRAFGAAEDSTAADPTEGQPWGKPVDGAPGWVQVPRTQTEHFRNASGLHPLTHPECFEWVWPDEHVAFIHEYGHAGTYGQSWRKEEDSETGARKMVRERGRNS